MATIINNPGSERVIEVDRTDSSSGWVVAVVILLAVIVVGSYAWFHYHRVAAATTSGGTNVNVTLPAPTSGTGY